MKFIAALVCLVVACAPRPTATPDAAPTNTLLQTPARTGVAATAPPETSAPAITPSRAATLTSVPAPEQPSPLPTARPLLYEDVTPLDILQAVLPNLNLVEQPDGYAVNGNRDWLVWVNAREEGHITQPQQDELVAIVASQVGANPPREAAAFGDAVYIVVLERRAGKLVVTQREKMKPPVAPEAIEVRIERVVDVDHDGQDEVLITTNTVQTLILQTQAHLLRWEGTGFVELWKGLEENDNTAAINQNDYATYEATLDFADIDNNGVDEIIVNATTTTFPKDAQGRADLSAPSDVTTERAVYKWNGTTFALAPELSTPAQPATTTP